ncbi:hypothetical protein LguiB_028464 [Lonicera macranthoides]
MNEETDEQGDVNVELEELEESTLADTQMAIASMKKNLKEVKSNTERSTDEINYLKVMATSLKLQKAAEEVDEAKSLAQTAREELRKAKEAD